MSGTTSRFPVSLSYGDGVEPDELRKTVRDALTVGLLLAGFVDVAGDGSYFTRNGWSGWDSEAVNVDG